MKLGAVLPNISGRLLVHRRLRILGKLSFIIALVVAGFAGSFLLFLSLVQQVRIGGGTYREIRENLALIETIALLKSDLNQVRAEMLALATERDADRIAQTEATIERLRAGVEERFDGASALLRTEDKKLFFADARSTWEEFSATIRGELLPLVREGRVEEARQLALGIQAQRYTRFIDQTDALVMTFELENEELEARAAVLTRRRVALTAALSGAALLLVFALLVVFSVSVSRRLGRLRGLALAVAEGDLAERADEGGRAFAFSRDEISDLYEAFTRMRQGLRQLNERVRGAFTELEHSVGDVDALTRTINEGAKSQSRNLGAVDGLITRLNDELQAVTERMDRLSESSGQTASSTQEMMAAIGQVAVSSSTLFGSVESTSSSMEEILRTNQEVAGNIAALSGRIGETSSAVTEIDASLREVQGIAQESRSLAEGVKQSAREEGGAAVAAITAEMDRIRAAVVALSGTMQKLSASTTAIGDILTVIEDVAEQTNLLALNAAIIAAQAGEHGRGFSVVAEEIRELAERTASSTKEIGKVISGIQSETRSVDQLVRESVGRVDVGVDAARRTKEALDRIIASAEQSVGMSARIAQATAEQAAGSRSAAAAVLEVGAKAGLIARSTEEQGRGSAFVLGAIEQMRDQAAQVRRATEEQSAGARVIAEAGEQSARLAEDVKGSTRASKQLMGVVVEQVVAAGRTVEASVAVAAQLEALVRRFTELSGELRATLDQYRA